MTISEIINMFLGVSSLLISLALFSLGNRYKRDFLKTQHENDIKLNELVKNTELRNTFRIKNYEYFISKRNESYSELFCLAETAYGCIVSLLPRGIVKSPTFDDFNTEDIKKVCNDLKFPNFVTDKIAELWDKHEIVAAKQIINQYRKLSEISDCDKAHQNLINKKLLSRIYIDDDVIQDYDKIIRECKHATSAYETMQSFNDFAGSREDIMNFYQEYENSKGVLKNLIESVSSKTKNILNDSINVVNNK